MTVKELYDKLCSPGFQKTEDGDLFYNFYIYQYDADKEYEIRDQIKEFRDNLIRPTNYVDVLCLNLFDEFCHFLDNLSVDWYTDLRQLHTGKPFHAEISVGKGGDRSGEERERGSGDTITQCSQ